MQPKGGGAKRRPLWDAAEGGALLFFNLFAAFGYLCWPQPVSIANYFGPRKCFQLLLNNYICIFFFFVFGSYWSLGAWWPSSSPCWTDPGLVEGLLNWFLRIVKNYPSKAPNSKTSQKITQNLDFYFLTSSNWFFDGFEKCIFLHFFRKSSNINKKWPFWHRDRDWSHRD